jgi:hypothetical protein
VNQRKPAANRVPPLLRAVAVLVGAGIVLAALPGSRAWARGEWNIMEGNYQDDLVDASDLDLVQGLLADPTTTCMYIPAIWAWHQPSGLADATNTLFSYPFSSTRFVEVFTDTTTGSAEVERVKLLQRWFSAEKDMQWEGNCQTLPHSAANSRCYIFPFLELNLGLGARSERVLLVQDMGRFNDCQSLTGIDCAGTSKDYKIVSLYLSQFQYRTFIESGHNYNVTWFIRSPGQHPAPGFWVDGTVNPSHYNNRLVGFYMSYSYTGNLGVITWDSVGGATNPMNCTESNMGAGCLSRNAGSSPHVLVNGPLEPGGYPLYLNSGAWDVNGPFTPFSFSFTPGAVGMGGGITPWTANGCDQDPTAEMNWDLCTKSTQGAKGTWEFHLTTVGHGGAANVKTPAGDSDKCGGVVMENARASASLFIDGMMLTAGSGSYTSPIYDSLSTKTAWQKIEVDMDRNLDPPVTGLPRTPVKLLWRVGNNTEGWTFGTATNSFMFSLDPALPNPSLAIVQKNATTETLFWTMTVTTVGQYFQYRTELYTRDNNPWNPPPPNPNLGSKNCLRYGLDYDGSLNPKLNGVTARYNPEVGLFVTKDIHPGNMKSWKLLTYQVENNGGQVTADVLDRAGNVAVTADGIALAGVASGVSLARLDPGLYPVIRLRFTLDRLSNPAASPRVCRFRVDYETMRECLAVNRNVVRLSQGEEVAIRFCTGVTGLVEVKVHDAAGALVRRLFRGELRSGEICHKTWNGTSDRTSPPSGCDGIGSGLSGVQVSPGVYFITSVTPQGRQTLRVAVSR